MISIWFIARSLGLNDYWDDGNDTSLSGNWAVRLHYRRIPTHGMPKCQKGLKNTSGR